MIEFPLCFEGRLSRAPFAMFNAALAVTSYALAQCVARIQLLPTGVALVFGVMAGLVMFLIITATVAVWARRLHDLNYSGWHLLWIAGTALPFAFLLPEFADDSASAEAIALIIVYDVLTLLLWLWMLFAPGTKGPNAWGDVPE